MSDIEPREYPLLSDKDNFNKIIPGQGWRQAKNKKFNTNAFVELTKFSKYTERGEDWHKGDKPKSEESSIGENKIIKDWKNVRFNIAPAAYTWDEENKKPDNISIVRQQHPEYIFMDIGRWKGVHRDFGVIWGKHVYLCNYNHFDSTFSERPGEKYVHKNNYSEGLDSELFKGFERNFTKNRNPEDAKEYGKTRFGSINIQAFAWANWGKMDDYDWKNIYIIIPDMHLMSVTNGKIWYKYLDPKEFNLETEIHLMNFADDLLALVADKKSKLTKDNVKVIQIGDSFDLWVGCGIGKSGKQEEKQNDPAINPLFEENKDEKMILRKDLPFDPVQFLKNKIDEIRYITFDQLKSCKINLGLERYIKDQMDIFCTEEENAIRLENASHLHKEGSWIYLNPAELAFRKLNSGLGKDGMRYIYGNHDNYLIDDNLIKASGHGAAKLRPRKAWIEEKALFVEHAQRMERFFSHDKSAIQPIFKLLADFTKFSPDYISPGGQSLHYLHYVLKRISETIPEIYPTNEDGSVTGFQQTNIVYLLEKYTDDSIWNYFLAIGAEQNIKCEVADWVAGSHDQPIYGEQFAKFWMGRKSHEGEAKSRKPPSIFVIGHTHMPELYHVKICTKLDDDSFTQDEKKTIADMQYPDR